MNSTTSSFVQLLGRAQVRRDEVLVDFQPDKRFQLLAYLAHHGDWVNREQLAYLFWSDGAPDDARNNLRQLLARVRALDCAPDLEAERHRVRWLAQTDVADFLRAINDKRWQAALESYPGALLAGLEAEDTGEFAAWLELERQNLHSLWTEAVNQQARMLEQTGEFEAACDVLERLVLDDLLAEDALVTFLRLALPAGRRTRALERYRIFAEQLSQELGLEPRVETQQLAETIQNASQKLSIPERIKAEPPREAKPFISRLPVSTTPFVGREAELAEIANLLAKPDWQIVTVCGPGGMGKTRLALEAARRSELQAIFVPLAAHASGTSLASSVAAALGQRLAGKTSPETELLELLEGRELLLVLDNLEHLVSEARGLVEQLRALPELKLLLTSRVRLGLASEQVFELGGFVFPSVAMSLAGIPFEDYDAIRFLIESARRAQPGLMLSAPDRFEAVRICELLVGVPLALELAGAWARLLTLPEIRQELERNLDFLAGSVSGLPERHQGLRAVFEHSWALLEPAAQGLLKRLAVFRGGFERSMALQVAGTGNLELLALLDHCLLRRIRGRQNRFELHELIRQYALEKLEADATEVAKARQNHFEQFLMLAETAKQYFHSDHQVIWLERLELEHDNLSAALQWALGAGEAELGLRLAGALCLFWDVRGHGREGRRWLEQLLTLPEAHLASSARVKALVNIGIFATQMADYPFAREQLEAALKMYQLEHDQLGQAIALRAFGELERSLGELEQAAKHLETSIALLENLQAPIELAKAVSTLGIVEAYQGNPEIARKYFEKSLSIFETLQDRRGMANQLANIANTLPNIVDGRSLIERSLAIKRELGDQDGIAISMFNLGNLVAQLKDLKNARAYMCQGLEISWKLGHRRQTAHMLISIADVDMELGNPTRTLELAAAIQAFTQKAGFLFNAYTQNVLETTRLKAEGIISAEEVSLAQTRGRTLTLEQAVQLALENPDQTDPEVFVERRKTRR